MTTRAVRDLRKALEAIDARTLEANGTIDRLRKSVDAEVGRLYGALGRLHEEIARIETAKAAAEPEPAPKLTREQAEELMEKVELPRLHPSVPADEVSRFEQAKCQHCHGIHARKCPAVKTIDYYDDGKVKHVTYFPHGQWPEDQVIWLEDVMAVLEDDDADDDDTTTE